MCGEITPDKRITVILIMLLILLAGNVYFCVSTIYNWGKESEKRRQIRIEHIIRPEWKIRKDGKDNFIDSEIDTGGWDVNPQGSDSVSNNKKRFKTYERTIKTKYAAKAKA